MRSLLSGLARVHSNAMFIRSLFEFLALEPRIVSPASSVTAPYRLQRGVRFRDVTFAYRAFDGVAYSQTATATLVFPNERPVANDDQFVVRSDDGPLPATRDGFEPALGE